MGYLGSGATEIEIDSNVSLASLQGLEHYRPIMRTQLVHGEQSRREETIPSQYKLVPEYTNICTSVLSRSKQVKEIDKKVSSKFKVFVIIDPFAPVVISVIRFILIGTASFSAKMLHQE